MTEKCINTEEQKEKGTELLEKSLLSVFLMVVARIPDYILVNYFHSERQRRIILWTAKINNKILTLLLGTPE